MDKEFEMEVTFPGRGHRVDVHYNGLSFCTDKAPEKGGEGEYMTPGYYFLGAIAACTGSYVRAFCQQRDLTIDDMRVVYHSNPETKMVEKIEIKITTPPTFPKKYLKPLVRSAEACWVKKQWRYAPEIDILAEVADDATS